MAELKIQEDLKLSAFPEEVGDDGLRYMARHHISKKN